MPDEPVTEQRPCEWPIVYGYLRLDRPNPSRHANLHAVLSAYCERHELRLATVFTDHGSMPIDRPPGFVGLLDVLSLARTYGALIPSRSHLGRGDLAAVRASEIARTSTRLMIVRGPRRQCTSASNAIESSASRGGSS